MSSSPVEIVCPSCKQPLHEPGCECSAGTRLEFDGGIPRLLFGQKYWGETSSANMARILELMETRHWREAVKTVAGKEAVHMHLNAPVGPDISHALPWQDIKTVLDIGAGMGFMACALAQYAPSVVAVEAVPERAKFLKRRAEQDGLPIYPIIANGMNLPFKENSFDLISLNGVFEYLGLWAEGDPDTIQRDYLKYLRSLLKPNGILYVGIETRYAWPNWFGALDHSGLAYTSIMPRKLADLYCRIRSTPFYGSEHVSTGYRIYTHTPRQYDKMFRDAGFETVDVLGVTTGYNVQRAIYHMDQWASRAMARSVNDPIGKWLGMARRLVTNSPLLYRTFEEEVLVLGRKGKTEKPQIWSEVAPNGRFAQLNTGSKITVVCFDGDTPTSVVVGAKSKLVESHLQRGFQTLAETDKALGTDIATLPMRWPKPIEITSYQGRPFYRYEYVDGQLFAHIIIAPRISYQTLGTHFERLVFDYIDFCEQLTAKLRKVEPQQPLRRILSELAAANADPKLQNAAKQAVELAEKKGWKTHIIHGDLAIGNIIVPKEGKWTLIDWEGMQSAGLIAIDLMRLYYDITLSLMNMKGPRRERLGQTMKTVLRSAFARLGYQPEDYKTIETLYMAEQACLSLPFGGDVNEHLELYESRELELAS